MYRDDNEPVAVVVAVAEGAALGRRLEALHIERVSLSLSGVDDITRRPHRGARAERILYEELYDPSRRQSPPAATRAVPHAACRMPEPDSPSRPRL